MAKKYFVRVYDDIAPVVVYGPFDMNDDEIEQLACYFATVLPYDKDDGIYLLEIGSNGEPSMRAFGSAEIEEACKLAKMQIGAID